jgi:hypothetical protein
VAQGDQPPVRTDRERQPVIFHSPLRIFVLTAGTAIVPWRILRSPRT